LGKRKIGNRRKWILGKRGRLRLKREDDWEIGEYWEGRMIRNRVGTRKGVEIGNWDRKRRLKKKGKGRKRVEIRI
jgi:hypothetical protein